MDQLSSRAAAVQSSLDNLQREQNVQGIGLRGDMAASQERMNIFMAKAQESMRAGDAKSAKKYMELADGEIEKLEAFLGH
jgi:hypothetical protein